MVVAVVVIITIIIPVVLLYARAIVIVICDMLYLLFWLQAIATGKYHGAILTNSEEWETRALEAGRKSGDLLAPLVYCPELHFTEFSSTVADMKNSVGVSAKFIYIHPIHSNQHLLFMANLYK